MELHRAQVPKQRLSEIPVEERTAFLLLGHFANELNALQKLFYWCSEWSSADEFIVRAHTVQALVVARTLVGKLNEGWGILDRAYFGRQLGRDYDSRLTKETRLTLQKLRNYFGKENLVNTVRNNFAFHYSPLLWDEGFQLAPADERWEIYLAEANANCLYYASELVANYSILDSIVPGKHQEAMERLIDETIRVAGWFMDFVGAFMIAFSEKHLLNRRGEFPMDVVQVQDTTPFASVKIPFFVEGRPTRTT